MPVKTKDTASVATTLSLPVADAVYLAKAGLAAASKDDITPIITGVVLSAADGVVKAVSTDRYRVHRATVESAGADLAPFLLPQRALRWLVSNASFFVRPRQVLVEPIVTFTFFPQEWPDANKVTPDVVCAPSGSLTISIVENGGDNPDAVSVTTELIKGNFPPVERLLDAAIAADDVSERTPVNLDLLSRSRVLARWRDEQPVIRTVKTGADRNKSGQMLVVYPSGVCLIQRNS